MIYTPSNPEPARDGRRRSDGKVSPSEPPSESVDFRPNPDRWSDPCGEDMFSAGPARVIDCNPGFFAGVPAGRSQGEALMLTDSLPLVLEVRQALLDHDYDLTWTNNFWLAMSYLQRRVFSGLILDARVESVESRFIVQFLEEYGEHSSGARIILAGDEPGAQLRRINERAGHVLMNYRATPPEILYALGIRKD